MDHCPVMTSGAEEFAFVIKLSHTYIKHLENNKLLTDILKVNIKINNSYVFMYLL